MGAEGGQDGGVKEKGVGMCIRPSDGPFRPLNWLK